MKASFWGIILRDLDSRWWTQTLLKMLENPQDSAIFRNPATTANPNDQSPKPSFGTTSGMKYPSTAHFNLQISGPKKHQSGISPWILHVRSAKSMENMKKKSVRSKHFFSAISNVFLPPYTKYLGRGSNLSGWKKFHNGDRAKNPLWTFLWRYRIRMIKSVRIFGFSTIFERSYLGS